MENRNSHESIHPTTLTASSKHLKHSSSIKRLVRKPNTLQITSPSSKRSFEIQPIDLQSSGISQFARKTGHQQTAGSIEMEIKKMCYISPRNSKNGITGFFKANEDLRLCLDILDSPRTQISEKTSPTFQQNNTNRNVLPRGQVDRNRKKLSRTSNEYKDMRKSTQHDNSFTNRTKQQSFQDVQLNFQMDNSFAQSQQSLPKDDNFQLMKQNTVLKTKLDSLKDQNEYLRKQIQSFYNQMADLKAENQKLWRVNAEQVDKITFLELEIQNVKRMYWKTRIKSEKFQILQHTFRKIRDQHFSAERKNNQLEQENQRLFNRIETLSKILEGEPIPTFQPLRLRTDLLNRSPLKKSKGQEKQNMEPRSSGVFLKKINNDHDEQGRPLFGFNLEVKLPIKTSRKQDGFYDLSPE